MTATEQTRLVGTVTNQRNQPMLGGLFTPLATESEDIELAVTGNLPADLNGMYIRNGPNPMFEPRGGYHMFDGDAMLHRVLMSEGVATYRSKWVRTAALQAEIAVGRSLYGGMGELHLPSRKEVGSAGPIKNPANTNIVNHAGRFLALYEAAPATEVTADLSTIGLQTFGGAITGPFTAHPKVDPRTGELHAFSYLSEPPYLQYHLIDADGEFVRTVDIELAEAVVMHDFVVTEDFVVFVDSPLLMDLESALNGGSMFRWEPAHGTRIGVLAHGETQTRWFQTEDAYVNHFWNGWVKDGVLTFSGSVLTSEAYSTSEASAMNTEGAQAVPGLPTRFTVNLNSGAVVQERLDELGGDFPRINEAYLGVENRYRYMVAFSGVPDVIGHFDTVVSYDDLSGDRATWFAGPGMVVGEAVFVADPSGVAENDGWLLAMVSPRNPTANSSTGVAATTDLVVIDARDVAAGPVARMHLPDRLPFGFHGNFFASVGTKPRA